MPQFVHDLVGHRHQRARVVGQRRLGHQDEGLAIGQAVDDLPRGLAPRELTKVLLDVLDLEGAALQRVLLDQVFHAGSQAAIITSRPRAGRQYSMPITWPASSTSSFWACGTLPRPGISIMLPAIATTKPAPAESVTSLMDSVHPSGRPHGLGIVGERILRLGDAHGQPAVAERRQSLQAGPGRGLEGDASRPVDLGRDGGELLLERHGRGVKRLHARRIAGGSGRDHPVGKVGHAVPALDVPLRKRGIHSLCAAVREHGVQIAVVVGRKPVQRHDRGGAPALDVRQVPVEVREAGFHRAVRRSALRAERLQRHDHDRRGRHVAAHRHHEVEELLGAEIGGKAGFVHDVVGQVQTDSLRQHAAGAVRDVREGAAMDDAPARLRWSAPGWAGWRRSAAPSSARPL